MTAPTPAVVAGPGALSQRSTGGQPIRDLPDPDYGEATAYEEQQKSAPLANSAGAAPPRPAVMPPSDMPAEEPAPEPRAPLTPLFAPTQRPDEPLTAGAPIGPGAGPVETGIQVEPGSLSQALGMYLAADNTGVLANLANALAERGL